MRELSRTESKLLQRMLREAFDKCDWWEEDDIIGLAIKMGFTELSVEMEMDKTSEPWAISE